MPRPGLLTRLAALLSPRRTVASGVRASHPDAAPTAGSRATVEVPIEAARDLRLSYRPSPNGAADAGEIAWTWVPYQEAPTEGKDRPVLIIGRADDTHVYAVKLTSKAHDGERDFLPLGTGPWDSQGRESWVDIDQLYRVHVAGIRREAAPLDKVRFARVATELQRRYGWAVER